MTSFTSTGFGFSASFFSSSFFFSAKRRSFSFFSFFFLLSSFCSRCANSSSRSDGNFAFSAFWFFVTTVSNNDFSSFFGLAGSFAGFASSFTDSFTNSFFTFASSFTFFASSLTKSLSTILVPEFLERPCTVAIRLFFRPSLTTAMPSEPFSS